MKTNYIMLLLSAALLVSSSTAEATQVTTYRSNVIGFNTETPKPKVKKKVVTQRKATITITNPSCGLFEKAESKKCNTISTVVVEAASYSHSSRNLAIADDWIGTTEKAGREKLKSFMGGIDPRKTKWCVAFINAVLKRAGKQPLDTLTAVSYLNYGVRTSSPLPGDIVVLRNKRGHHAGFYVATVIKDGRKYVKVLGGNQSNAVQVSYYPASSVIQYRTGKRIVASNH